MALRRYAPEVRSFALCDGHHEPYNTLGWCKRVGILPPEATVVPPEVIARIDLAIGGVNHCTWIVRFRYDGKDMMPRLREEIARAAAAERTGPGDHSKRRYNETYALELFDIYGAYPTAIGHTKEYVPFYQGWGVLPVAPEPIALFDADRRVREMAEAWKTTESYASGTLGADHFLANVKSDHASDIMEAMWGNTGRSFYINGPNRGAITNLEHDAFVELRSDIDMRGPRPQPFGAFPRGLLALQQRMLDTHELTAEAAVTCDRATLRRAMLTDPLCVNVPDADACIRELLEAERDALPAGWYRGR
jgi:alpha-galactosidase